MQHKASLRGGSVCSAENRIGREGGDGSAQSGRSVSYDCLVKGWELLQLHWRWSLHHIARRNWHVFVVAKYQVVRTRTASKLPERAGRVSSTMLGWIYPACRPGVERCGTSDALEREFYGSCVHRSVRRSVRPLTGRSFRSSTGSWRASCRAEQHDYSGRASERWARHVVRRVHHNDHQQTMHSQPRRLHTVERPSTA